MGGGPVESTLSEFSDYCMVSEVSSVQLLYSKSRVYVYRSTNKKDRISGFICIVRGPDDQYYIAWTPEALLSENDKESYVQVELCPNFFNDGAHSNTDGKNGSDGAAAHVSLSMLSDDSCVLVSTEPLNSASTMSTVSSYAFCKPVGDIASLLIHPPSLTQWYGSVILNLADGSSLAPLWFHDDESASTMLGMTRHWGGDELLVWLAHAVAIERSLDDPNRYEIQGSKTPHVILSKQNTPVDSTILPSIKQEPQPARQVGSVAPDTNENTNKNTATTRPSSSGMASSSEQGPLGALDSAMHGDMDPLMQQVKELRWGILERFSRITRTVKDATTSFIDTPVGRQVAPYIPPSLGGSARSTTASGSLVKEYEGARIYLAKWAAQHIIQQQHEDGERESELAARGSTGKKLPRDQATTSVWEEWVAENGNLGAFEVISTNKSAHLPQPIRTKPALTAEQWFSYFEPPAGSANSEFKMVASPDAVRRAIFAGGVEEDMRPVVWKYLLDIHPWGSTEKERIEIDKRNTDEYWSLKEEWLSDHDLKQTSDFIDQQSRIEKDVLRTDRTLPLFATDSVHGGSDEANVTEHGLPGSSATLEQMKDILMTYHFYDKASLGYVQGMSDLLAPIYSVYQDEPTTFWAFVSFMRRMRSHFLRDQSGMQDELTTMARLVEIANPQLYQHLEKCDASNMFSCYRWLLIWFKREFTFENILRLWEVLWTDYLTDRFVLFIALAILQRHADVIMDHLESPEEVLKYVQDLSECIDLNDALKGAEMCFYKVRHRVRVVEAARKERGLELFVKAATTAAAAAAAAKDDQNNSPRADPTGNDAEVPLISFDWEEPEESTPMLYDKGSGNSPSNSATSPSSPPAQTKGKERDGSAAAASALPEISETVHSIFAHGYQN